MTRQILKGVSGTAYPGQTMFIMGASGCGKTSLLNQMSDRIQKRKHTVLKGEVLLNDKLPLNLESFSKIGAYVM